MWFGSEEDNQCSAWGAEWRKGARTSSSSMHCLYLLCQLIMADWWLQLAEVLDGQHVVSSLCLGTLMTGTLCHLLWATS